jgi:hypothetical protein
MPRTVGVGKEQVAHGLPLGELGRGRSRWSEGDEAVEGTPPQLISATARAVVGSDVQQMAAALLAMMLETGSRRPMQMPPPEQSRTTRSPPCRKLASILERRRDRTSSCSFIDGMHRLSGRLNHALDAVSVMPAADDRIVCTAGTRLRCVCVSSFLQAIAEYKQPPEFDSVTS